MLHLNLGIAYRVAGNKEAAIAELRQLLLSYPDQLRARSQLAAAFQDKGDFKLAAAEYEKILQHESHNFTILYNLGTCYLALKSFDQAVDAFTRANEIDKNVPTAHALLATAQSRRGRLDEAASELRTAISLKSDNSDWHAELGDVLTKQKDFDAAIAEYQQARA